MVQKEVADRRAQVLKARAAGMDWEQIARTVPGINDAKAAAQDYRRAMQDRVELRELSGDDRASAVELELTRLDSAYLAVEGVLRTAAADPTSMTRCSARRTGWPGCRSGGWRCSGWGSRPRRVVAAGRMSWRRAGPG